MGLFEENLKGLTELFGKRPRMRGNTGILDTNNQVNPNPSDGLPIGYTWFRAKGERTAIAVLNVSVTNMRANIPVIVEENDSGNLEIIKIDTEDALYTYEGYAPSLNMPDRIPEGDKWSLSHKRVQELRLRLSSTGALTLHLNEGYYQKTDGDIVFFAGADIDLTASLPGTTDTKRLVLIGITIATNTITQSAITAVDTSATPTTSPYFTLADVATAKNAAVATVMWIWAVPLFYGDTEIINTDSFIDLRPIQYVEGGVYQVTASSPLASSGGSAPNISLTGIIPIANGGTGAATAVAGFNALSPLTTKGDLLANDGVNDTRLAVGTNGYNLRANSAATNGFEWSEIGATYEATLSTSGNTVTTVFSYAVAELVTVTIHGHYAAAKTDKSFAAGGSFRASYRRATGGNVALVGTGWIEQETDSVGVPVISVDADTGTQSARIRWQGVSGEDWIVKCQYEVIAY